MKKQVQSFVISNARFVLPIFSLLLLLFSSPATAETKYEINLDTWRVEIFPETLSFSARMNDGTSFQLSDAATSKFKAETISKSEKRIEWSLPETQISVSVDAKGDRLYVRFSSKKEQSLTWPIQKENSHIDAFTLPDGEGLYLPVSDNFWGKKFADEYCQTLHGGLSMPFWGAEAAAASFAFIAATDIRSELCLKTIDGKIGAVAKHDFLLRDGLNDYEIILVPTARTPIGSAIEYRKWLVERNEFVSFKDKIAKNPNAEKLVGATQAYLWGDGRSAQAVSEYHKAGIDRMWLGYDQDPRSDKYLVNEQTISEAKKYDYLIGPYDTLDNIQPTTSSDAISSIFDDYLYKNGCVIKKDGKKMIGFAGRGCQLSSEALRLAKRPFLKERIEKFKATGANSYFLDCDAFGDFLDDYDSSHPMTKAKDKDNRSDRMAFISDGSQLVLGSEGGTAWATKYVHFLHGANDTYNAAFWPLMKDKEKFGTWWPPEGMGIFFKKVKPDEDFMTAKYSPQFRLPLFQTVFHDSVVSTERWELSLSKMPAVAKVRALFWQLYNVAPIWNFNMKEWKRYKERAVEHHKFFSEIHRTAAYLPVTSFEWLTKDRRIQRISYGDSVKLTANFSDEEFEGVKPLCIEASQQDGAKKRIYCPQSFPQ